MVHRDEELDVLQGLLKRHRVVGITGARQVGKTTLARGLAARLKQPVTYFDLENPADQARLAEPLLALESLGGLIVIDEIQRSPHLFEVLRVLVDRPRPARRFLVLGSASPELLRQSSETLAGRIVYHQLAGFSLGEIGAENYRRLWLRGGFPRAYLARSQAASFEWREAFIRTFLERDLPGLGITIAAPTLRRFWTMLAHYHGQTWNSSEFGRSFGVADTTVRHYLDLLTQALVVWQLSPWHENISKRQVKSPKVYISDSGLLHGLLGLSTFADLDAHPKVGASWEGFAIGQVIHRLRVSEAQCHFWATHAGAELDLLVVKGALRLGFEVKRTMAPKVTPSMRAALADLRLKRLDVIHAGSETFPLSKQIRAVALSRILIDLAPLS
jgi:predicted AAA+ superfamily ATPase